MKYYKVIIVGGGPAGSSCGWKLKQNGIKGLILDKQEFPRAKLCAGWITPNVINQLKINLDDYPCNFTKFDTFHIHIYRKELKVKVQQYAIRRYEFDQWLLERSGVEFKIHEVIDIKKDGDYYIIDDKYYCTYLVGAGGTHCPVYRTFFKDSQPRQKGSAVTTLEVEFPYDYQDSNCHLWFLFNRLPGYAWYVPKKDGYLNIGIGGFVEKLKANNDTIKNQWHLFINELKHHSLLKNQDFKAKGYIYYIRNKMVSAQKDNLILLGDSAGLATRDMGEGIGPAVKSGILAADVIAAGKPYSISSIEKYSFPRYRTFGKVLFAYLFNHKVSI
jgi:flavin-dependent dehydrogenase